jgi:hypothetical protein
LRLALILTIIIIFQDSVLLELPMHYKTRKWNEVIDPAFNKIIRAFLDGLKLVQIPANEGYLILTLSEDQLKNIEKQGFPTIAKYYEKDGVEDLLNAVKAVSSDEIKAVDFRKIGNEAGKGGFDLKTLFSLVESIEEKESRNYYLRAFASFQSKCSYRAFTSNTGEKAFKKWGKKIWSDIFSMFCHISTMKVKSIRKDARYMEIFKERNVYNSELLKRYLFLIWDAISIVNNRVPLRRLFDKARRGDAKSLFKLIQLDKTIFDHEWVRTRIRKALYEGDMKFIGELADNFKKGHFITRKQNLDIAVVVMNFWSAGIYRLTTRQKMALLKDSGMKIYQSENSFRQLVDRLRPFLSW